MENDELTERIIGAAMAAQKDLGPGLLRKPYMQALLHELCRSGHSVESDLVFPVVYKGLQIDEAFKVDLLVDDEVIVGVRVVDKVLPIHKEQLISQLRHARKQRGLLFNFHEEVLANGIFRLHAGRRSTP